MNLWSLFFLFFGQFSLWKGFFIVALFLAIFIWKNYDFWILVIWMKFLMHESREKSTNLLLLVLKPYYRRNLVNCERLFFLLLLTWFILYPFQLFDNVELLGFDLPWFCHALSTIIIYNLWLVLANVVSWLL